MWFLFLHQPEGAYPVHMAALCDYTAVDVHQLSFKVSIMCCAKTYTHICIYIHMYMCMYMYMHTYMLMPTVAQTTDIHTDTDIDADTVDL